MTKKAKEAAKESATEESNSDVLTSQQQLKSFLKRNKESHYNFEESVEYKVSSGSLLFDYRLSGGLGTGLHRFIGINEGGKTSCALQFMKSFLDQPKKRKGFYVKAEGRLSKEMIERCGVKFVFNEDEWVEGTCFVFESNIHETVFDAFRELVGKNDEKIQYFFLLDSVDGLIRKGDLDKTFEESQKVAGGAVIAADLMKRMSIALHKRGHIAIFISQVRADIKLDPYTRVPIRQTTATGGNALLHFANWIIEFEARFKGDLILRDDKANYDEQKNPYIGHTVKVTVKKSPNEKTNSVIKYPICYGRKNGTSNWIEKEIFDFLLMWGFAEQKGAWIIFDEDFIGILKEAGFIEFPEKIQGTAKFESIINDNEKLKKFLYNYISNNLLNFENGIPNAE